MIDSSSIVGSVALAQATRAGEARAGDVASVAAVKTTIAAETQVVNNVIEPSVGQQQPQFLYDSEGNLSNPPADESGKSVNYKA